MGEGRPIFHCRQCGECCQGAGGILVQPEEVERIAAFLHLPPWAFKESYVVSTALGPQLATVNGACVFLDEQRCRVHPVKPRICREWPFLPALLAHADEFEAAKGACPGIDQQASHQEFIAAAGKAK